MNLPLATHRWIVASGDQDFWLDVSSFRRAGTLIALLALGLGIFSIRAAGRTFASAYEPRRHWLLLMGVAMVVSVLRGFAEFVVGTLTPWRVILSWPSARSTRRSGPSIGRRRAARPKF